MRYRLRELDLDRIIGRGGTGEVWAARHRVHRAPVAVKILPHEASDSALVRAIHLEMQATATLRHAHIVAILDVGTVQPDEAAGPLVAGSPFIVMERASSATLLERRGRLSWPVVREVLLALLDALGHAHARGVIHKDVKPSNVLVCGSTDERPGLKLTDFGIAHLLGRHGVAEREYAACGSPHYMAPEHGDGRWRRFGPWTDLYSLGITAFELATGVLPFVAEGAEALHACHREKPLPKLTQLRGGFPPAFEAWVERLTAKRPEGRFPTAADAAYALQQIPAERVDHPVRALEEARVPVPTGKRGTDASPPAVDTSVASEATVVIASAGTNPVSSGATSGSPQVKPESPGPAWERPRDWQPPPIPPTWERPRGARREHRLARRSLGLVGLRRPPFVGRRAERDALWGALQDSVRRSSLEICCVSGEAGSGKSRLVEWIVQRAVEVGAVQALQTGHGPTAGLDMGIRGMITRALGADGLTGGGLRAHVRARTHHLGLDEAETLSLVELFDTQGRTAAWHERASTRHRVVARWVGALAEQRPVAIVIDDAQWGLDALNFVAVLTQECAELPVTVMLTVRTDALGPRSQEADALDRLRQLWRVRRLKLEPLSVREQHRLVSGFLDLESEAIGYVTDRSRGNPLYAIQLTEAWIEAGQLSAGPHGYRLLARDTVERPLTLSDLWSQRLEAFLREQPEGARMALEIAAALGHEVRDAEWEAVCTRAGVALPLLLSVALQARGLAEFRAEGWVFGHGLFRERLETLSREAGRWRLYNRICADTLQARYGDRVSAERLGRHYLAAEEYTRAIPLMIEAIDQAHVREDDYYALALLSRLRPALDAGEVAQGDPVRGTYALSRAQALLRVGRRDEAIAAIREVLEDAELHGWDEHKGRAMAALGSALRHRGELVEARRWERLAVDHLDQVAPGSVAHATALWGLAWSEILQAGTPETETHLNRAMAIFEATGDVHGRARCWRSLGDLYRNQARYDEAMDVFGRAKQLYVRIGATRGVADTVHGMAEIHRFCGRLEQAEAGYVESIQLERSIGLPEPAVPKLNLALVRIEREDYREAGALLDEVIEVFRRRDQEAFLACAYACQLPIASAAHAWGDFDVRMQATLRLLDRTGLVDPDVAWPAERAGDLAWDAGEYERAREAWELASDHYARLRDGKGVDRVRAKREGQTL